jgi:hypothetical protein
MLKEAFAPFAVSLSGLGIPSRKAQSADWQLTMTM